MYSILGTIQGWCPWCGDHMGWGGGWGMMFGWLLILVVIVLAVWVMSRGRGAWGGPGAGRGRGEDRAEALLREQYARGEIDEEMYRRRLKELRRE